MDTCTVETGFLRKKPCGHPAVTHCANCEQPLCAQHAVAQLSEARKKTGQFMCKECDEARREYEKDHPRIDRHPAEKRATEPMKGVAQPAQQKPKPAAPGGSPAAPPQGAPAATAKDDGAPLEFTPSGKTAGAAAPEAKPAEKKPDEKKPDDAPLEFTPSGKKPDSAPLEFTRDNNKK